MRHPFLYHPRDPEAWKVESAYYLGASLWTAPVVERAATTKDTWLPPGKWVDFFDHAVYEGGQHATLPAPLDRLPLLVKDGGVVPLLDSSIETLAPATQPGIVTLDQVKDRLDVVVALSPNRDASFVLADGTTLHAHRAAASGPPSALVVVDVDQLATCANGCVNATADGGVDRLRITTPLAADSAYTHDDVTVEAHGPSARRVRWDVMRFR
jgi:alpha-D-xyloside xylohydrolase